MYMDKGGRLRILIINEHLLITESFKLKLLDVFKGGVLFMAKNADFAIRIARNTKISLVFLNAEMEGKDSSDLIKRLKTINPKTKVIVFSYNIDDELRYIGYIHKGADAFLDGRTNENDFKKMVSEVLKNGFFHREVLNDNIKSKKRVVGKRYVSSVHELSDREYEIANLLVKGYKSIDVALSLNLKRQTVSTYKKRVFEKFCIDNIIQLSEIFKNDGKALA